MPRWRPVGRLVPSAIRSSYFAAQKSGPSAEVFRGLQRHRVQPARWFQRVCTGMDEKPTASGKKSERCTEQTKKGTRRAGPRCLMMRCGLMGLTRAHNCSERPLPMAHAIYFARFARCGPPALVLCSGLIDKEHPPIGDVAVIMPGKDAPSVHHCLYAQEKFPFGSLHQTLSVACTIRRMSTGPSGCWTSPGCKLKSSSRRCYLASQR